MKIEVKNIKIADFASEETLCFNADVFADGKKIAWAKNDGRGGCTMVMPYPECGEQYEKALQFAKTLPATEYPAGHGMKAFSVPMDLENLVDDLVGKHDEEKQKAKLAKRLQKDCLKGICYGNPDKGYKMISWKNKTLAEILAEPRYKQSVRDSIAEIVAELKDGEKILNTNIPTDYLK